MSVKSKSSTRKPKVDPARPFDAKLLETAKGIAEQYQVVLRFDRDAGEFYGCGLELPLCMGDGKTADACVAHTREAIVAVVATMLERNEVPPPPYEAVASKRTEQVNVRLTMVERNRLERASQREGFTGISDFVRNAALTAAR